MIVSIAPGVGLKHFEDIANHAPQMRTYTPCFFDALAVAPQVVLIDAADDAEAMAGAEMRRGLTTREVWDRHRLVGVLQPTC